MTSRDDKQRLRKIRVYFDSEDTLCTMTNGTVETIEQHYLNHIFNIGSATNRMARCTKIEFLDGKDI